MATHQNADGTIVIDIPDDCKGDTMIAKLNRAKTFDTLAHEADLIDLEAKCRIADALELLVQIESIDSAKTK